MVESLLEIGPESGLLLNDVDDLFIKPQKKYKVLLLSDHPLAPSGVGVQARMLIEGLLKTGRWTFRCLGGAMKHARYDTVQVNPDFIVKPVDGFGNKEMIKSILMTERPDALMLFTDPRQFIWVWEMADEIQQVCPIVYWHVWDNDPYPQFNFPWYKSTDLINCLAYKTYETIKDHFPQANYIPHAFPKTIYFPLPEDQVRALRKQNFGERGDWFLALWVNRNATRKMPADTLQGWKLFLDKLEAKYGHRKAALIMHTDPNDPEGPNLLAVADLLSLSNNVLFSAEKIEFPQMNILHNMADVAVNIAKNEGFGLPTLEQMMVGKPIIALKTGGLTRQVVDYRDGSEHGAAITPSKRSLVGSQITPYIYEDYCTDEQLANAFMKIYEMTPEEKANMKTKVLEYVDHEFNYEKMVSEWDRTMFECIETFKKNKESEAPAWTFNEISPTPISLDPVVETPPVPAVKIDDKKIRESLASKKLERKSKKNEPSKEGNL